MVDSVVLWMIMCIEIKIFFWVITVKINQNLIETILLNKYIVNWKEASKIIRSM